MNTLRRILAVLGLSAMALGAVPVAAQAQWYPDHWEWRERRAEERAYDRERRHWEHERRRAWREAEREERWRWEQARRREAWERAWWYR